MKRSIRRPEWRGFLVGGLLIFAAPGLALAQNNFPLSGNVGIGIGASATGTTANILHIDAAAGGQLHLTSGANSGTTTSDGTFITHFSDNNLYITNMESASILLATTGAERMRVTSTGNVGVGTGNPTGTMGNVLHVNGPTGGQIHLTSGNSGTTSGDGTLITHYSDNNLYITNMENADVLLNTNGGVERMRVTSAGNVGIGTGAPAARLHVAGDVQVDGNLAAGA